MTISPSSLSQPLPSDPEFIGTFAPFLEQIYPDLNVDDFYRKLAHLLKAHGLNLKAEEPERWDQSKLFLITYGDSLRAPSSSALKLLLQFLQTYWAEVITCVHILPFFPYSSDDGFSIIDYRQVRSDLGTWADIEAIAAQFDLMSDLVINHMSSQSHYFQQFLAQEAPGKDYVLTVQSTEGYDNVVRPRNTPFVTPFETVNGTQLVWTTFSADQIDWDFHNPDVLLEFVDILLGYCQRGCRFIRLDAVGYLWKKTDSSCIHLQETHAAIKFLNRVLRVTYPHVALITETNVPNRENLSYFGDRYFGDRNEAHLIYNFSLPPLVLNALVSGEAIHLKTWIMSMPPAPKGCTYFNFTASHDGVGLRPTEGLLEDQEFNQLIETMQSFGGQISYRKHADGKETPYELNISWFDALKGTHAGPDQWQRQRFLCSQAIMMALEGVPAFYIHSLLATPNDEAQVKETGIKRRINRYQWDMDQLQTQLEDSDSDQAWVLTHLKRLMAIRRLQPAFHPNATQFTMNLQNPAVLGIWRQSRDRDQSIFSLHNLSKAPQTVSLKEINLICVDSWSDLLKPESEFEGATTLTLDPYQTAWITNLY